MDALTNARGLTGQNAMATRDETSHARKHRKTMKIGFSGAANCGKTTLSRMASEQLGLPLIEEGFPELNRKLKLEASPDAVLGLFLNLLEEKEASENRHPEGFVSDRTPIDLFMYFCSLNQRLAQTAPKEVAAFQEAAEAYCRKYDLVVIPPWGVVSYTQPAMWSPKTARNKMNPWVNLTRHAAPVGASGRGGPETGSKLSCMTFKSIRRSGFSLLRDNASIPIFTLRLVVEGGLISVKKLSEMHTKS